MKKRPFCLSAILGIGILLFFWLPGCKKKETAQVKTETIGGVTYVHNPATPLHPERNVTFEEELTFKDKDETGEIRLYKPGWYTVDSRGNVYIEDDSDMAIKVFDPRGKYVRTIGRQGSGPGEFARIGNLAVLPDGRLLVTDFEARRTSLFSPEGQFLSSFQWKKFFSRVHLATDSSYAVNEMVLSEDTRELWVKTIDFDGNEVLSFGKFSYPEMKMLRQGEMMFSTSVPWSPASVFAGDQKRQWLYHCLNEKYVIEVYNQKGKLFRRIDRPYEPMSVTDEDINRIKSEYADRPDSPFARLAKQIELPKLKTVTDRMIVDSDGNLWVRTNEEKREGEQKLTAFDVFDSKGFYTTRVWLDFVPQFFPDGKMYRDVEDEQTGLRQIKRYRVVWKES
jgi:6-bladed beta-propeller